ncbi:hypothetical protein CHUAL_001957 [Chamberlinius hualienensis]
MMLKSVNASYLFLTIFIGQLFHLSEQSSILDKKLQFGGDFRQYLGLGLQEFKMRQYKPYFLNQLLDNGLPECEMRQRQPFFQNYNLQQREKMLAKIYKFKKIHAAKRV